MILEVPRQKIVKTIETRGVKNLSNPGQKSVNTID